MRALDRLARLWFLAGIGGIGGCLFGSGIVAYAGYLSSIAPDGSVFLEIRASFSVFFGVAGGAIGAFYSAEIK